MQRDLQYLEKKKQISYKYHDILSKLSDKKSFFIENSQKLSTKIHKHGKEWHRKIDAIIQKVKYVLDEMDSKGLAALTKEEAEITLTISEITKSIADLKKILDSNDIIIVSSYKSRIDEHKILPPKLQNFHTTFYS